MQSMFELADDVVRIEAIVWERLFHEGTELFYDFVSSYNIPERFQHLPHPDEIRRQLPNPNGWGTGMEDSTINGGVVLVSLCDKFDATGDEHLSKLASSVLRGLVRCATQSREDGFILRSISPEDGSSYFIETSRDQITHFVHGTWRYYHSPLSTEADRQTMRNVMVALCRRLEERVIAETDFHFGKEDGTPGLVDKMWQVAPHETLRLPMCYAVAWDMTGDQHWHDLFLRYMDDALNESAQIKWADYGWCYALFQHQVSMEVLVDICKNNEKHHACLLQLMRQVAQVMPEFTVKFRHYQAVDVGTVDMDWRNRPPRPAYLGTGYNVPEWPPNMLEHEFRPIRETGEGILCQLMAPGYSIPDDQQQLLGEAIGNVDYDRMFTYAMLYPLASYWRWRRNCQQTPV